MESKALPIILIALTNHALDHMLRSVLDAGITKKIIRLGGRSADEKIQELALGELEKMAPRSRFASSFSSERKRLKEVELNMTSLLGRFLESTVPLDTILEYLSIHYPDFYYGIGNPPSWISDAYQLQQQNDAGEEWKAVDHGNDIRSDLSLYSFWAVWEGFRFLANARQGQTPKEPASQSVRGFGFHVSSEWKCARRHR